MAAAKIVLIAVAVVVLLGCGSLIVFYAMVRSYVGSESPAQAEVRHALRLRELEAIAKAAMECSRDSHGRFPSSSGFREAIKPYLAKGSMSGEVQLFSDLDRIVWRLPPGAQTPIPDAKRTEMVSLPDIDGRAVAFADGSVRWIPK